jgi:hypothetical protein
MNNLGEIIRDLVIIKFLAVEKRDYNNPKIQESIAAINYRLDKSTYSFKQDIEAFNRRMSECIKGLEYIRDETPGRIEPLNFILEKLYQIISKARRLQELEYLVAEIELNMKLG